MVIDWKKVDTVFRLLAAVYAVLGENAFKGQFRDIAKLYGPEASYDAIKSEWKKVVRLSDDLRRRHERRQTHGRGAQAAATQRRQHHPRETIKPETHNIIDLDSIDALREPSHGYVGANRTFVSSHAAQKHKLDAGYASLEREPNGRVQNKRVKLDPALYANSDEFRKPQFYGGLANQKSTTYSDDLFEQIRRAISTTPVPKSNTNPHAVTPSRGVIVVPSTIEPTTTQVSRAEADQPPFPMRRERSQCQVSNTEHDRRDWEAKQQQTTRPLLPRAAPERVYAQATTTSPEAGPSRTWFDGYAEAYPDQSTMPEVVSLSDSDEDWGPQVDVDVEINGFTNGRKDKGKGRMIEPALRSSSQHHSHSMPSRVSYINTELGVCYLCSVHFGTPGELRVHERGAFHLHKLTDEASIEKAQTRLENNGLLQNFCCEMEKPFTDRSASRRSVVKPRQARTVIRGPDRAVQVDETTIDLSESQDVVEVSKAKSSAYRTRGKNSRRCRMKKPLANVTKKSGGCTNGQQSKAKRIKIHDPKQMARMLQVNKFSRSGTVDRVLSILERVLPADHRTASKHLNEFSSLPSAVLPLHSETRHGRKVWIIDAEFANLKGNRYDLSVTMTNLASGRSIVNHRLELLMSVDELEAKIWAANIWHARNQFIVHHRQPCSMPVITPRELARLLRDGGFGPRDFIFVWHSSDVDYFVVHDFLARADLQHGLMPPRDNVVRVLLAWQQLLPGVKCGLENLFSLVFPSSPLRYVHHIADVDTKKLGLMTWKLKDLHYTFGDFPTVLDLCA